MTSAGAHLTDLYKDKGHQYFSGAREDIIALLPRSRPLNILEVGCGDGSTGAALLWSAWPTPDLEPLGREVTLLLRHVNGRHVTFELPMDTPDAMGSPLPPSWTVTAGSCRSMRACERPRRR